MNQPLLLRLAGWTAMAALTELLLLRIGTRTFVHIPGLDLLSGPLAIVAETGRLAYYLTVVLVMALAGGSVAALVRGNTASPLLLTGGIVLVALSSCMAALGLASPQASGWLGLVAVGLAALPAVSLGSRGLPLLLWSIAMGCIAIAGLLQSPGAFLDEGQFGALVGAGDLAGVSAAATLPLLLGRRPSTRAVVIGVGVGAVVAGSLWAAPSTTSILVLWSFGIPAGLPSVLYGVGAGAAAATAWSALQARRPLLVAAVVLLGAGGFGLISTYQTTLVVVGLALAVVDVRGLLDVVEKPRGRARGFGIPLDPAGRALPR